ncbi:MAG: ferritin-like domain-containing protein [Candidatus Bathyarchaeia archaeon]
MNSKDKLVEFLGEQIRLENEIIDSLNNILSEIKNPIVRGVLRGISLDAMKHTEMCAAAVALLTGVTPIAAQEPFYKQKMLMENHLRVEGEFVKRISEIVADVENEKVKLLLNAILSDEKTHYELLKLILEIIMQAKTLTEDELWDILWKNVPFHGAPGG